ncbi:inorganic phosphate transporter [Bacillus tianshenii]|nr:inorganic phosphate transporter [Bacillus tianshenii]
MTFVIIAFVVAYFFALNIGASGAAAAISVAHGTGAISSKRIALAVCSLGICLGAILGGGEVVETVGKGIVSEKVLTVEIVIVILASAALSLFIANLLGIPLSTSEVAVGAVVGVGISLQSLNLETLFIIMAFWIVVPVVGFLLSFTVRKLFMRMKKKQHSDKKKRLFIILLIGTGFLESFSAGMNNVANAVGPLVGAGLLSVDNAVVSGGICVALGAFLFGGKVVETNANNITKMSLTEGIVISGTSGILVVSASLFGIPIPLTQVTTTSIVGVDCAKTGMKIWQKSIISRIIKVWIVSPVFSLVLAYALMIGLFQQDVYTLFILLSVMIATIGTMSLIVSIKKEKQSIHEHGGGI